MLLDDLDDSSVILLDASSSRVVTAGAIRNRAAQISQGNRKLVFLIANRTTEAVCWFLALLEARHPVALIDPDSTWPVIADLIDRYRPQVLVDPTTRHLEMLMSSPQGSSGRMIEPTVWVGPECRPAPHEELAVLLTTSGSTGSPKFVRLCSMNIRTNAEQIVNSLGITTNDRGVTVLPLHYSFGMSVLTSHALAGSSVLVTDRSVIEESFWSDMVRYDVSFLPGVPTTYATLRRLGFERRDLPHLRALIQAGGPLAPESISFFHNLMTRQGGRFFVMYGQTEASPRISCLPSECLPKKLGSVGRALSGGDLCIRGHDGNDLATGEIGEVIYRGPNVMMGYAGSREDLALGHSNQGVLATGDLGYLDDEGFLYLIGRSKRICKLAGARVSLDELESIATGIVGSESHLAAVDGGDAGVSIFAENLDSASAAKLRRGLQRQLRVPPMLIGIYPIDAIPLLANGKTNYAYLERMDEQNRGRNELDSF